MKALDRIPGAHNPLLIDSGDTVYFGKKRFRFENGGCNRIPLVIWLRKPGLCLAKLGKA